jgi:hypothetical protein
MPRGQDGGGSISKEELADLMALLNIKKTPEELDADMAGEALCKLGSSHHLQGTDLPPPAPRSQRLMLMGMVKSISTVSV